MEELDKKTNVEELTELMEKIELSMEMSRNRQANIEKMTEELYDETKPMMVEKRKEELENAKSDKAEFDEMTKNALINAKKHILQLREEREKEYQAKLLHTVDRKTDIQTKLLSMKQKGLPIETVIKAEDAANRAMTKVNDDMKKFQDNYFALRKQLEDYEKNIWDNAVEIGVEKEIDAVTLEEKVESEKTEPPKQEPPKQEPPKQEPPKQEPPKQDPPKQDPPKQDPPKQEPPKQDPPKPSKPEINEINFDEATGFIEVTNKDGKLIFAKNIEQYVLEKRAESDFEEKIEKSYEDITKDIGEDELELLDSRILLVLSDIGTKDMMMQYAKSIVDKETAIPFKLNYNLKDIYNGGRYNLDGIKKINMWARIAKKQNKNLVDVEKDNIFKRAIGNIKLRMEERKLLPSPQKEDKEKTSPITFTKEAFSKGKEKIVDKAKDVKHFTSKKLSGVKQFGKERFGKLNIAGTRISGYFKGENPLVTDMKVNNIREKSFVPKAKVDEKTAVEKVNASRQTQNEEVRTNLDDNVILYDPTYYDEK